MARNLEDNGEDGYDNLLDGIADILGHASWIARALLIRKPGDNKVHGLLDNLQGKNGGFPGIVSLDLGIR